MRLSEIEFQAMNSGLRRLFQKLVELPLSRKMGVTYAQKDILEIGCGSGYAAHLIAAFSPRSYLGIDLMPEQIVLAQARGLSAAEFVVADAARLDFLPNQRMDLVVIYGVLHHIPQWQSVVRETARLLRSGGIMYLEEPDGRFLSGFDRLFHWDHPEGAGFSFAQLQSEIVSTGLTILNQARVFGFGLFVAQKL